MKPYITLRWLNDACYEIKLANGKTILTDPFITTSKFRVADPEAVEGADYILVSHTHFDHIMDIPYFFEKYNSKIFCPSKCGIELARFFNLPGHCMYLSDPGDVWEMGDFKLECYRGKHTSMGRKDCPDNWPDDVIRNGLPATAVGVNLVGSFEYMNWKITFPWGQRLLIWGGAASTEAIEKAKHFDTDISIAQFPLETPENVAKLYAAIGGQYIFMHHHEFMLIKDQPVVDEAIAQVAEMAPYTTVINPQKLRWYEFGSNVTEL